MMMPTACLVTGRERAAIATIELRATDAADIIAKCFQLASSRPLSRGEVRYGDWHGPVGDHVSVRPSESIVIVFQSARISMQSAMEPEYLGNNGDPNVDVIEIHCHGGEAAATRILADLQRAGASIVPQVNWMAIDRFDLLHQESIATLNQTVTTRTAAIALDQVRGAMRAFMSRSIDELHRHGDSSIVAIQAQAQAILRFADFGRHLMQPWSVVLAGAPNVGKSSLINALVGYRRSITLDMPGTTRDVLRADVVIDGWPILLSDTAGIRSDAQDQIERQGIDRARAMLLEADLVVWVFDACDPQRFDDRCLTDHPKPLLQVVNKIDMAKSDVTAPSPGLTTSATTGLGIQRLRQMIVAKLIPELPSVGSAIPSHVRQVEALQRVLLANDVASLEDALDRLNRPLKLIPPGLSTAGQKG